MAAEQIQLHKAQKYISRHTVRFGSLALCLLMLSANIDHSYAAVNAAARPRTPALSSAEITTLRTQPLSLLAQFPDGGAPMARHVAEAVVIEPRVVPPILSIVSDTSPEQASAIGAGLVRAARSLEAKQPKTTAAIVNAVSKSTNRQVTTIFRALGPKDHSNGEFAFIIPEPMVRSPLTLAPWNAQSNTYVARTDEPRVLTTLPNTNTAEAESAAFAKQNSDDTAIRYAAIVSFITTDATSSGAVSTSPTE